MRVDKEDILYICMIPLIAMFLLGFYLFIGIVMLVIFGIAGVIWLWNGIMTFTILHLSAIIGIMVASFLTGVWYANNTYIRFKKTSDAMKIISPFYKRSTKK